MCRDFTPESISHAPLQPGAYRLYRNARVIHVGKAAEGATLRSELRRHLRGDYGPHTQSATEFDYRVAADSHSAYDLYLDLYLSSGLPVTGPRACSAPRPHGRF